MTTGQWVLVVSLVVAVGLGAYRIWGNGRFSGTRRVAGAETDGAVESAGVLDGHDLEAELGSRATLLQFSSAFCAPCRATRRVLAEIAEVVPGVAHVEVDLSHARSPPRSQHRS